jgi:GGDEF domain-containing protein
MAIPPGTRPWSRWPVPFASSARRQRRSPASAAKNSSSPDIYRTDDLHDIAEQLRKAIAATRYLITASIGIASAPLGASFDPAERELIDDLVNVADTAMYAAKRAGGNQSRSTHIAHAALKGSAA